jgi:hypothetical protein
MTVVTVNTTQCKIYIVCIFLKNGYFPILDYPVDFYYIDCASINGVIRPS